MARTVNQQGAVRTASPQYFDQGVTVGPAGFIVAPDVSVSGLPGAQAGTRLAGATTSGSPATGMFQAGDVVTDLTGALWILASSGTWVKLAGSAAPAASQTLATAAANITFSAIPQTFGVLRIVAVGASSSATETDRWQVRVSGDTGNNYDIQLTSGNNVTTASAPRNAFGGWTVSSANPPGDMPGASATAGTAGFLEIQIPAYAGTTFQKVGSWRTGYTDAATAAADQISNNAVIGWRNTAAITSVVLAASTASTLAAGTTAYLFLS